MTQTKDTPASLLRRLAAMVYDGLLLLAVWLVASALALLVNRGKAFAPENHFMTVYIFFITFFFFAWFWTHGGQTLGMKAWRLKLVRLNGSAVGWWHCLLRFLTALPAWFLLGVGLVRTLLATPPQFVPPFDLLLVPPPEVVLSLGVLWVVFDNSRFNWRDRFTDSRVIVLEKHSASATQIKRGTNKNQ